MVELPILEKNISSNNNNTVKGKGTSEKILIFLLKNLLGFESVTCRLEDKCFADCAVDQKNEQKILKTNIVA